VDAVHPGHEVPYFTESVIFLIFNFYRSLYGWCAKDTEIPCGIVEILIGKQLQNGKFQHGPDGISINNRPVNGLIHCTILCPANDKNPFLGHKMPNDMWMHANCFQCASKELLTNCLHSDDERAFTSVYTSLDIVYSLSIGWTILAVFEIWQYPRVSKTLEKFMKIVLAEKVKYDFKGLPEERDEYCKKANLQLQLEHSMKILPDDISYNLQKRNYYKDIINKLIGKI
jgi:hypothetical protein